jgi:F-type H+-transporting ATPase subunit epsilon
MSFTCTLVTPVAEVFEKEVTYVNLPAHDGQLGVGTGRAPLLARLGAGELTLTEKDGKQTRLIVVGGFAQIKAGKLVILTDETHELGAVKADQAQKELAEALAVKTAGELEVERKERRVARARALLAAAKN